MPRSSVLSTWDESSRPGRHGWPLNAFLARASTAVREESHGPVTSASLPAEHLNRTKVGGALDAKCDEKSGSSVLWRASIPHTVVGVQYASPTPDGRRYYRLDVQPPAGASIQADVFGPNVDQPGRWELQSWRTS